MFNDRSFTPDDTPKVAALTHVLYEMEMFCALPLTWEIDVLNNSLTEAYLIHARVLVDFFQKKKRCKDDILCSDYGFSPRPLGISEDIERRFDKSLAHLTFSRLCFRAEDRTNEWIDRFFRPHIIGRIDEFLGRILSQDVLPLRSVDMQRARVLKQKIGSILNHQSATTPPTAGCRL
jgi:hypothetical protein